MKRNLVPTYRLFPSFGLRRLSGFVRRFRKAGDAMRSLVQGLGSAADEGMIAALRWLGRHAVGRDLDVVEAGKLMLFLHKVVIVVFIAGYVVGYLVR